MAAVMKARRKHRKRRSNGTYIDEKGYPRISAGPLRGIRVHTVVAWAILGRPLRPDEIVHHKDDDKKNPHPKNLRVMAKADHDALTAKQYWFLKRLREREERAWKEFFASEKMPDMAAISAQQLAAMPCDNTPF